MAEIRMKAETESVSVVHYRHIPEENWRTDFETEEVYISGYTPRKMEINSKKSNYPPR